MKKFGTFGGVFTPSILTILGVIMYLRLGWVIGNAGSLVIVLGIILLAHIVSISTGLSISSIATDKKIKSGGIYYILSRSLGFPIGGAIGLTLFLATSLSISLYLIGFGESLLIVAQDWLGIVEITTNHLRIAGTLALLVIVSIAYISTSFAIKTQYLILTAIVLSLVSVFLGSSEGKGFDFSEVNFDNSPGFAIIFGVFFPAVTGFTAGVAMSGDLKDPKKSIPWGTMMAISVGFLIYVGLAIFLFFSIPGAEMQKNNNVLVEFSWIPQLVIAGIWGATLSSALGGILGGPRILQSMSVDSITPKIFAKGFGAGNEPRNALLLTFVLAEAGILIGELNVIAGIVAMFYMAAYMFINLSCSLEMWASPDFRPKFKINILIPLVGAIAIFLLMIQLNLVAALMSVLIMGIIFFILTRKHLELSSGDVWSSVWSSVIKLGLKNLDAKPKNRRNWEPNILLFSGGSEARPHLVNFSKAVAGRGGLVSNFDLIETPTATTLFPKHEQALSHGELKEDIIFHRKQECKNRFKGIEAIASTYGFSGIEPNTVLMGWARNTKDPIWFANMNKKLHELDYNVLYLDYDKKRGFGKYSKIDIWWNDNTDVGDLTLQIAKRVLLSDDWSNAEVRIFYLNNNHQKSIIEKVVQKQFAALRMDFPFQIVNNEIEEKSFYEVIKKHSHDADLIVLEIPKMKKGEETTFVHETNDFLGVMATTLLVHASQSFASKSQEQLAIEDVYQKKSSTLKLKSAKGQDLIFSGEKSLDLELKAVDNKIGDLNKATSDKIYSALEDVYSSFQSLLQKKYEDDPDALAISFLENAQYLMEDFIQNKRLKHASDIIDKAINSHLNDGREIINSVSKEITRVYGDKDLDIGESDSTELAEVKQKLNRKGKEIVKLFKLSISYFENEYLENLSRNILFIGDSGKAINNCFIYWMNSVSESKPLNIKSLVTDLNKTNKKISEHFLMNLNIASRQMCNEILSISNSLDERGIALLKGRKTKRKSRRQADEIITNYPLKWLNNQLLLSNHLLLHIQLLTFQLKISGSIKSTSIDIEKSLLTKTLKTIGKCRKNVEDITAEEVELYGSEFYQISNQISADVSINAIQAEIDINIVLVEESAEVISYEEMNGFESNQSKILPTPINARKIAEGLIKNEILSNIKDLYQQSISEVRTENTKIENALELLKFSLLNTKDNKSEQKAILQKTKNQLDESFDKIQKLQLNYNLELKDLMTALKALMVEESINKNASDFDLGAQKIDSKRLSVLMRSQSNKIMDLIDRIVLKTKDKVAQSDFQYHSQSFQNPHAKFADFRDTISLSSENSKKLPFYYNQLFTGKHIAPSAILKNRESELLEVKKAVNRFNEGKNGAILFTGDFLSGKTYLMQNAVNLYGSKKPIVINAPIQGVLKGTELLDRAFAAATGLTGDTISITKQLKSKSTIVFEDLELWWTRSPSGSDSLKQIVDLIKLFGNKHLFVLDCNIHFYKHIRQYIGIDDYLLATISSSALTISELSDVILKRHRSGGMKFIWNKEAEDKYSRRELNRLFRKITSIAEGNIGIAFYIWLGNIAEIKKSEIYFNDFEKHYLPEIKNPEWENMLIQILLHKQMSRKRLYEVYFTENEEYVNNNLQSLIRTGMVVKTSSDNYCISPYIIGYLTDYLRKKL